MIGIIVALIVFIVKLAVLIILANKNSPGDFYISYI